MSTASNIVLADGQASPANVTFAVAQASPAQSVFEDRSAGVMAWFRSLQLRTRRPSKGDANTRAQFLVAVPVTGVVSGVTVLLHTLEADVRIKLPDGCSDASRKDLYAFVKNGLAHALVQGAIRDYDFIN